MTPAARRLLIQARLTDIAAALECAIATQHLKRMAMSPSASTVRNVLKGKDHRISTLVEVADEANLDVEIVFHQRSA